MERDRRDFATGLRGDLSVAHHVRSDCFCGPHGRRRRGPYARCLALYLPHFQHHFGFGGDGRLHPRRLAARAAGPHHSALRHAAPHPRTLLVRHNRETGRSIREYRGISAGRDSPPAQHDRHRRHRHSRYRVVRQAAARVRARADPLRRDGAAFETAAAVPLHRASRPGKHHAQHPGRPGPG